MATLLSRRRDIRILLLTLTGQVGTNVTSWRRHIIEPRIAAALTAALLAGALCAGSAAPAVAGLAVEFPGPVPVAFNGDVWCATAVDFPDLSDRLLVGSGAGELTMVHYNQASGVFATVERLLIGGIVVAQAALTDAGGSVTGLLLATRDPDRLLTIRVARSAPHMVNIGSLDLDEDPGAVVIIDAEHAVVTLPGIDRLVWLALSGGRWTIVADGDAGDRPVAAVAADLDGDGVREVVVANAGVLSHSVMVLRSAGPGYAVAGQFVLPGAPRDLEAADFDGDGRAELAVVADGAPLCWLLAEESGQLVATTQLGLTVAADEVHLAVLPDGTWGLYPSSSSRGLLEYFRGGADGWARRDGYYPGCRPADVITCDLNGDLIPDLVSLGGTARLATVMFGNPDLAYWGFPALALPGPPGGLSLGDFDGNGLNDAVVMSAASGTIGFFAGRGDGGLVVSPQVQELFLLPAPMTAVEADESAGPELAVHDRQTGSIRILTHGDTGFAITSSIAVAADSRRLAAADVDADGHEDLLLLTGTAPEVRVLFGAGGQTFPVTVSFGFENLVTSVVTVDLDQDGDLDLVGSDAINRVWVAQNQGGRAFVPGAWLNAGSGARTLSVGDLDGDLDEDVVVASQADETVTLLENNGTGFLNRRIGSLALPGRPEGALVEDVNQDGRTDVIVNLREDGVIAVIYGVAAWEYTPPVTFAAGGDVAYFATDDFNTDMVPDILTLDASLQLGLTMLNVERGLVPVLRAPLAASCERGVLTVEIRPDRRGTWRLELDAGAGWSTLATDAGALLGVLDAEGGAWRWQGPAAAGGEARLRLAMADGAGSQIVSQAVPRCDDGGPAPRPVAWTREPWPNPFNPLVHAGFSLERPSLVTAAVYDLRGRLVATLVQERLGAGEHGLSWDGTRDGRPAEAGVYLLRINSEQAVMSAKLLLLK